MCNRLFSCPSILQQTTRCPPEPRLELPFGPGKPLVASALKAADLAPGAALHMSERVHPWQECNERLEARAAARRWRRRHQHQDAGRCHAGGKATARTAPGTPCKHSAHCLHFPRIAYQNLPSSPNRMPALWSCRPVRAAHLGEPRCSTPFLHRVISGAPAPTASRCFRPVHPPLLPHSPLSCGAPLLGR